MSVAMSELEAMPSEEADARPTWLWEKRRGEDKIVSTRPHDLMDRGDLHH